jgi:hypothetical protein
MNKVPNIISTKDLAYISDAIEWNYNAAKKSKSYEQEVVDEDISKALKKIYKMHKKISKDLLKLLGGNDEQN